MAIKELLLFFTVYTYLRYDLIPRVLAKQDSLNEKSAQHSQSFSDSFDQASQARLTVAKGRRSSISAFDVDDESVRAPVQKKVSAPVKPQRLTIARGRRSSVSAFDVDDEDRDIRRAWGAHSPKRPSNLRRSTLWF